MNEPQFDRLMEVLWAICERLPRPEPRSAEPEGLDAETLARAMHTDFDHEPTDEYLDDAVRIFRGEQRG